MWSFRATAVLSAPTVSDVTATLCVRAPFNVTRGYGEEGKNFEAAMLPSFSIVSLAWSADTPGAMLVRLSRTLQAPLTLSCVAPVLDMHTVPVPTLFPSVSVPDATLLFGFAV